MKCCLQNPPGTLACKTLYYYSRTCDKICSILLDLIIIFRTSVLEWIMFGHCQDADVRKAICG